MFTSPVKDASSSLAGDAKPKQYKTERRIHMECRKCVHRESTGFCPKKKMFVPRKQRTDGTNPAIDCKTFKMHHRTGNNPKLNIQKKRIKERQSDAVTSITMEA